MPGGIAVITIAVCTVFTAFTGGSGLTVVALGGLVFPMPVEDGYPESFALALVTATGSLGLLFPLSLPVILYSVVAGPRDHNVPVDALYLAGLAPGLLMMAMVVAFAIRAGIRLHVPRRAFALRELGAAVWEGKWELALPFLVIGLFATGLVTTVETAALAFAYAVVVEGLVPRQKGSGRRLLRALLDSLALTGSVLMLLSAAMGITSYVDAWLAEQTVTWVRRTSTPCPSSCWPSTACSWWRARCSTSSAIVVLAPLIATLGASFGVHPVHLGVVFLSNLQLSYILPPIGLCLFLASSRFDKSLAEVVRATAPFAAVMAAAVLLVTYLPALTVGVLELAGMDAASAEAAAVP